jgi:dextranase
MRHISRRDALRRAALSVAAIAPMPALARARLVNREKALTNRQGSATLTVEDIYPDRASYSPGDPAHVVVSLKSSASTRAAVHLRLLYLHQQVASYQHTHDVAAGESVLRLPLALPPHSFRGYGVELELRDAAGTTVTATGTALDVLDDWTQAPRYGFLSDFNPGDPFTAVTVQTLARYHVNVVQFYDWMWRHYVLMPPSTDFTDALGRALSLRTVREKVAACREQSMAALGYAAVYGAEPEYALKHPDQMLYDTSGQPYSLEKLFYIMNIHQGNPWRAQILHEMARAVREVPFDGLHLDQYGYPKDNAFGPGKNPKPYDLAEDFPPFIDDARRAVRQARPGTRVIFNCVDNWPIETVAPTAQDATYIEVWPPYDNYLDLQSLILEARRLAPAKQVILAAYLTPLLGAIGDTLRPAETATRLASAAIWANGGFHLLLGERNGALCDPYYPKYATLWPDFVKIMRRYYDFVVRYENLLSDRAMITDTGGGAAKLIGVHASIAGTSGLDAAELNRIQSSPDALPGTVWTIWRSLPGHRTLSLINLTSAADAHWNAPKPNVHPLHNLSLDMLAGGHVSAVYVADPDGPNQSLRPLTFATHGEGSATRVAVTIPSLEYWTLIVVEITQSR